MYFKNSGLVSSFLSGAIVVGLNVAVEREPFDFSVQWRSFAAMGVVSYFSVQVSNMVLMYLPLPSAIIDYTPALVAGGMYALATELVPSLDGRVSLLMRFLVGAGSYVAGSYGAGFLGY